MIALSFALVCVCSVWTSLGLLAVVRASRGRSRALPAAPPKVSVLKPLCGVDPDLEKNLETFFRQSYPDFEIVFGVTRPDDPAIAIVRALCARFPNVPARLVVHPGSGAINPKVDNLVGMLARARHDLVLISDSNVRARPTYLRTMVATWLSDTRVGLVTSLFAGGGESGLGAALENVQLNGFCAAGMALPTLFGDAAVVGKSMLLSRSIFESVGGFERVRSVLAEDFVMGKMLQHGGFRVRVAPTVPENVTRTTSLRELFRRQLRWAMLRSRLRPWAQLGEVLTSPLALLPLAWLALGPLAPLWMLAILAVRDVGGWVVLRGWRRAWIPALLSPIRELTMLIVWARAPLARHVTWRGHRVRLGAGTIVYMPPSGRVRRV